MEPVVLVKTLAQAGLEAGLPDRFHHPRPDVADQHLHRVGPDINDGAALDKGGHPARKPGKARPENAEAAESAMPPRLPAAFSGDLPGRRG